MKNKCKGLTGFLFGHNIVTTFKTTTTPVRPTGDLIRLIQQVSKSNYNESWSYDYPKRLQRRLLAIIRPKQEKIPRITYCKRCGEIIEKF